MKRRPYIHGPSTENIETVRAELVARMGEPDYRAWMKSRLLFCEGSAQWFLAARSKLAELVEAGRVGLAS
jgi:hypothetical protein